MVKRHRMNQNHDRPVFRFAPSPNGRLHLGHALSALENERQARETGGRLLLRIEDIDRARCTPALEKGVIADLRWLGISFDGPVFRQSEHFADYQNMLQVLSEEQGCELMEQVPRSLVLCAGRSTGDTARGDKVLEALDKLSAEAAARIDVAVVEDVGHHMHCVRSTPRPCFVRSFQHSDLSRPFSQP